VRAAFFRPRSSPLLSLRNRTSYWDPFLEGPSFSPLGSPSIDLFFSPSLIGRYSVTVDGWGLVASFPPLQDTGRLFETDCRRRGPPRYFSGSRSFFPSSLFSFLSPFPSSWASATGNDGDRFFFSPCVNFVAQSAPPLKPVSSRPNQTLLGSLSGNEALLRARRGGDASILIPLFLFWKTFIPPPWLVPCGCFGAFPSDRGPPFLSE